MPRRAEQVAENESRFRSVNERLHAAEQAADPQELLGFVCECGELECTERIELTDGEYRHVRADGATFALKIGHEKPDFEEILERADRFLVVRKFGVAGLIAEQRAPNA